MAKQTSTGVNITLYESTPYGKVPTGAHLAKISAVAAGKNPTVTTDATTAYDPADDDIIIFPLRSGMGDAIDGQVFLVDNANAATNTFDIVGADTTGKTFENDPQHSGSASYIAEVYKPADAIELCLTSIDFSPITPNTINVGSFCDPRATIESSTGSQGSMTLSGHVDGSSDGYKTLAKMERHGSSHPVIIRVKLPNSAGDVFAWGMVSNIAWDVPLDGVIGFTCELTTQKNPTHRFPLT